MFLYLLVKSEMRLICFCNYQKTRSVFIYTVNDSGSDNAVYTGKARAAMFKKRIHKCSVVVSRRGMNDHSLRFIDNEKIFVFVNYIERNILSNNFKRPRFGLFITNNVSVFDTVVLPLGFSAYGDGFL